MRIIKPGEKLTKQELRFFSEMAGRAYLNDPVHTYATKDPARREKFVSHFMMERLNASNGEDFFYIDEACRGLCVWRRARNPYTALDFLKCADWLYLYWFWPNTLRTLSAYAPLDVQAFREDAMLLSPVFVAPEYQGKGIATALLRESMKDLSAMNYSFALEAQSEKNVRFYEKLGFSVFKTLTYPKGNITHYLMEKEGEAK